MLTAQPLQVIQWLYDTTDIAMAIPVCVSERCRVDLQLLNFRSHQDFLISTYLIYHTFFPPEPFGFDDIEFRHLADKAAAVAKLTASGDLV